jgi:hypothetical protein
VPDSTAHGANRIEQGAILTKWWRWNLAQPLEHLECERQARAALAEVSRPRLVGR